MSNDPNPPLKTPISQQPLRSAAVTGGVTTVSARPKPPNKHDELRLLINSRHPIITVETPEEERLEVLLMDVATDLGVPHYEWSVTTGLAKARVGWTCTGDCTGTVRGTDGAFPLVPKDRPRTKPQRNVPVPGFPRFLGQQMILEAVLAAYWNNFIA